MSVHFSTDSTEWATPQALFDEWNKQYQFTLDPCASRYNHKCENYYTVNEDGLAQDWTGHSVFMNPPYGREIKAWVEKSVTSGAKIVIALLPARTDTAWFHDHLYGKLNVNLLFIRGRLVFGDAEHNAPFPSMIAIIHPI